MIGDPVVVLAESLTPRNGIISELDETHATVMFCAPGDNQWDPQSYSGLLFREIYVKENMCVDRRWRVNAKNYFPFF